MLPLFAAILWVCSVLPVNSIIVDGSVFASELTRLANDAIGIEKLQQFYDSLVYDQQNIGSGSTIVQKMADDLALKFKNYANVLDETAEIISSDYSSSPNELGSLQECCKLKNLRYDTHFAVDIDVNSVCISKSSNNGNRRYPTDRVITKLKENYRNNRDLLWQYYGDEDGTFTIYPARKSSTDCYNFDPRFRPYYVKTAAPASKDIVIVLDTSKSMDGTHDGSRTLITYAKQAAIAVLETLNPNDRVAVIGFTKTTTKMMVSGQECYSRELSVATRTNKIAITKFINGINTISGESNFTAAFDDAFQLLIDSQPPTQESRERRIIFLTDGNPSSSDTSCDVIKTKSGILNNDVFLHIFGLGEGIDSFGESRLRNFTTNCYDSSKGFVKGGFYKSIKYATDLKENMAGYYRRIPGGDSTAPIFTAPFIDTQSNKSGLIMSICLPVFHNGARRGVLCSDVRLSELLSNVQYFKEGELSYAFLIDGHGRVLLHYLQPYPSAYNTDPDPLDISTLERGREAEVVIQSMKRGETGDKAFESRRTISRGALLYEGIESPNVNSHYFWTPIDGTNFSICVVLAENDEQKVLKDDQTQLRPSEDSFLYHRRDIYPLNYHNCRQYSRFATKAKSMVMLTPHAFDDPYGYLFKDETEGVIKTYTDYMNRKVQNNPGIKDGVRNSVAATYMAEKIWKENQDLSQFVVWRYLGTDDGHVRVYPAVQITHDYDHFLRHWWKRTMAFKGINVVIAPYIDLWSGGMVVTQCKALYEGKSSGNHDKSDKAVASICIDFPYSYFSRMFINKYSDCKRTEYSCMLIDVNGYLVVHPDFDVVTDKPDIERIHLGAKEGDIMEDLENEGLITASPCTNFETNKNQFTYFMTFGPGVTQIDRILHMNYKIFSVPDSNLYIIIKKRTTSRRPCCSSSKVSPDAYVCRAQDCCLCYQEAKYDVCKNSRDSKEASPTCSARIPDSNSPSPNDTNRILGLPICFDVGCANRKNSSFCYDVAGCSWCTQDYRENLLEKGCCNLLDVCPFGQQVEGKILNCMKDDNPSPGGGNPQQSSSTPVIVGAAIGAVVVIVIVVIVVCVVRRHIKQPDDTYLDAIPSETQIDVRNNEAFDKIDEKSPQQRYSDESFETIDSGVDFNDPRYARC